MPSSEPLGTIAPEKTTLRDCLIVFSLQFLCAYPMRNIYLSLQDEGNILAWASRMRAGQIPFEDFHTRFMPGTGVLLRLCFDVFGETIEVARGYFMISISVLAVVIWLLGTKLMSRQWAALPVLCFLAVGAQVWPMLSYHWDASITALLALLLMVRVQKTRWTLLGAGFLGGCTVLLLQPRGVAICLTLGILALYKAPRGRRLSLVIAGAAIPGALFVSWLVIHGLFAAFWEQAVLYNIRSYSETQRYPFEWGLPLQQAAVVGSGLASFGTIDLTVWLLWFGKAVSFGIVDFVKYFLLVPVIVITAVVAVRGRESLTQEKKQLLLGLVVLLLASTYLTWTRATRYHLNFLTPAWYPLFFFLLWRASHYRRRLVHFVTAVIAAAFLVHGLDNWTSWSGYRFPVSFRRGLLYSNDPKFAQDSQALTSLLSQKFQTKPVFGFPEIPMVLWLSGTRNPTSFESLVPLFFSDSLFEQARREIQAAAPCGVLFRPSAGGLAGNYPAMPVEMYERSEREKLRLLTGGRTQPQRIGEFLLFEVEPSRPLP